VKVKIDNYFRWPRNSICSRRPVSFCKEKFIFRQQQQRTRPLSSCQNQNPPDQRLQRWSAWLKDLTVKDRSAVPGPKELRKDSAPNRKS